MSFSSFSIILAGVLLNAVAQLFLKAGTNVIGDLQNSGNNIILIFFNVIFEYHIFLGLVCYVLSVGIWIVALSRVEVSIAYPMLSIGYVLNAVMAYYLFGEALNLHKLIGIVIIMIGVYILARS
ncbi:MAG: EamA family transporter [Thiotrichales bacterium]|jgi:multidrug transporter EmrE-like cation transporter|nr:EamA family transporter [Thiotrichales bacterium]